MRLQCRVQALYIHIETVDGVDEDDCIAQAEDNAADVLGVDSSDIECTTMIRELD